MANINTKYFCYAPIKDFSNDEMIRFVVSKEKFLIPDLYCKFTGEEFFVKSSKKELEDFSNRFCKSYMKFIDNHNIVNVVENILLKHIIGIIGLARKARKVIIGFNEIKLQLYKNKIHFLLQSKNQTKRVESRIKLPIFQKRKIDCLTKEELGIAFRKNSIANIGFLESSFINPLISDTYRLQSLRG